MVTNFNAPDVLLTQSKQKKDERERFYMENHKFPPHPLSLPVDSTKGDFHS